MIHVWHTLKVCHTSTRYLFLQQAFHVRDPYVVHVWHTRHVIHVWHTLKVCHTSTRYLFLQQAFHVRDPSSELGQPGQGSQLPESLQRLPVSGLCFRGSTECIADLSQLIVGNT